MDAPATATDLGLYVHIPFCSAICTYCNFNRGLFDAALKREYVAALLEEMAGQGSTAGAGGGPAGLGDARSDTLFFGGGTPSLLDASEIGAIIEAARRHLALAADAEITLEANPETVDRARLDAFRAAGVNRLSFGVQSFQDRELQRLGRIHSASRARLVVAQARAAGFDNVSLDLMMWLPGQRVEDWLANVESLIDAQPDHASLYLLELYPNAPLKEDMARAGWSQAPDEDAAEMYLRAMARLETAGFAQYEISNVARPGRESRHNLKYWTDGEWLAFGCGAHATRHGERSKNVASTRAYIDTVRSGGDPVVERRRLSGQDRLEEALFTGLRLNAGLDIEALGRRYGVDIRTRYGSAVQPFMDAGWLLDVPPRWRLTRDGMLMANEIMATFV